jgi:hypothetical protein
MKIKAFIVFIWGVVATLSKLPLLALLWIQTKLLGLTIWAIGSPEKINERTFR